MNIEEFKKIFNTHREYNHITIRYTTKRDNDITHKEIIITYDDKNNKYTIEHLEKNESRNSIKTLVESEDLTSETLKDKHRYIATLFESLPDPAQPKKKIFT